MLLRGDASWGQGPCQGHRLGHHRASVRARTGAGMIGRYCLSKSQSSWMGTSTRGLSNSFSTLTLHQSRRCQAENEEERIQRTSDISVRIGLNGLEEITNFLSNTGAVVPGAACGVPTSQDWGFGAGFTTFHTSSVFHSLVKSGRPGLAHQGALLLVEKSVHTHSLTTSSLTIF